MRRIRDALRLAFDEAQSIRMISKSVGVSRDAITDYLTRFRVTGISWPLPPDIDDAELERLLFPSAAGPTSQKKSEPDWAYIHVELRKRKGATLQQLHREFIEWNPDGISYSFFCQRHREFTKTLKRYMRQTHAAGDKVFVDYAGPTIPIYESGASSPTLAQIFVGVLGASSYIYAEATASQQLPNWIASHVRMFEHFGGAPAVIVCDNLKSAVTRASNTEPVIHPTYLHMASHYRAMVIPARPRKPKDKAKAENGVLVVERWILFRLRRRVFTSLGELNAAIRELLVEVNGRPFKRLPGTRKSAFDELDRHALRSLPLQRYEFTEFKRARVGLDYHVETHPDYSYSVPYQLVRQPVDLRITAATVEVLHRGRRVASHVRLSAPGCRTNPEHMDPSHRYLDQWTGESDRIWAAATGLNVAAFLVAVLSRQPRRELAIRSVGSLKALHREYGDERLDSACRRALEIGITEVSRLRSMLRTGLDLQRNRADQVAEAAFNHENVRGSGYYH